jgi:large subunit ribosomal protein L6
MSGNKTEEKKAAPLSRLGRKPVEIPSGVKVSFTNGIVNVEGSKGKLNFALPPVLNATVSGNQVLVGVAKQENHTKAMHGMARKLVLNMIEGVTKGFQKKLMIEGVGYRAQINGNILNMSLGFSHPVNFPIPAGIKISQPDPKLPNLISIEGIDKQKVGQVAAQIRSIRKPEPYKGTGIRYENEIIKRKAGKAAVGAAGGAGAKK